MTHDTVFTPLETITREVMEQYEQLRRLGPCNMFDFTCVILYACQLELYDLAALERDDYLYILRNFGRLMAHYGITQPHMAS